MRYLPRVEEDRPARASEPGAADTQGSGRTRFPRAAGATQPSNRDALPTIGTVEPRRGFPKLLGTDSGSTQGMGPSATRLARARDAAQGLAGRRLREPATPDTTTTTPPTRDIGRLDPGALAGRYRRSAAGQAGDTGSDIVGPATGRLQGDEQSRLARARAQGGKELASPGDEGTANKRLAAARAKASAGESAKGTTLRERAYANPERTRHFLANRSNASSGSSSAVNSGLNYALGWPGAAGGGIKYGCWDDDWVYWFDWCYSGGNPWSHHGGNWWWHANYWGCWPWGTSYWWWGAFWYPVFWYGSYSPATVIVYEDAAPTTVIVEAPPAYPAEAAPDAIPGEAVLDEDADPNARAVDESMDRLLSPGAVSASRAATQNLSQGDAAFREGRFGDAVHYYAKAIEFQPDQGVLYLVLSDALFATGDYHYGAYALRKALDLDPTLVENPVDKHGFYSDPQEFDRELAVLETYLKDRPTDMDARVLLAANYLFGLRPAAAVDLLEEAASESVRKSPAGALLLAAARAQQYGAAQAAPSK